MDYLSPNEIIALLCPICLSHNFELHPLELCDLMKNSRKCVCKAFWLLDYEIVLSMCFFILAKLSILIFTGCGESTAVWCMKTWNVLVEFVPSRFPVLPNKISVQLFNPLKIISWFLYNFVWKVQKRLESQSTKPYSLITSTVWLLSILDKIKLGSCAN